MDYSTLKPSLWRTYRVLANKQRLRLLQELFRKPGQNVTDIATRLRLPIPLTSKYLRELNARGLLGADRVSRWVVYSPKPDLSVPQTRPLLTALQRSLRIPGNSSISVVFRLATAFTHPRRIAIVAALRKGSAGTSELCGLTHMSRAALDRHLKKLRDRGFVSSVRRGHQLGAPKSPVAGILLRLALMNSVRLMR